MIRIATDADAVAVADLLADFHAATPVHCAPFDSESAVVTVHQMNHNPMATVLVSESASGDLVGTLGGLIFPQPFNLQSLIAQEVFWWVAPNARKLGIGAQLLSEFETWATSLGADAIIMASLSGNADTLAELYGKRGYAPLEHSFVRKAHS